MIGIFESKTAVPGDWLLSPLRDVITTGDYSGLQLSAADAILVLADRIEGDGIAPECQKALADLLRYLVQLPLRWPE
ncbi:hypothetical protein [Rhizobium sp. Root482]|uniref:hypothetical protein n=1 Tax=Rhizobium sp. Root482 TaxID=1736543 RepID=UPI0006F8C1BE|nr:hypothetical protein [Rhizobium sp. Root482]KQY20062.1 hypothetical protein ASD31_06725 [Rhizobium sp. Root482]